MSNIDKQALREKFEAWAEEQCALPWGYLKKRRISDDTYSEPDCTDMWAAWKTSRAEMIEALEKAQLEISSANRVMAVQDLELATRRQRIAELEKGHQEAAKQINSWRRLAKQNIAERGKDISELEAARQRIAEQSAIVAAAEKLVRCKGRYHSELNYRALAKLFGVITPDLPPLEHENVHYADDAEVEITALRQCIAELEAREVSVSEIRKNKFIEKTEDELDGDHYTICKNG
ncbi:protein Ead [Salmonella enterica subsp. enterica]|nr:protein Ead [Salmonella enterica]EDV1006477.1 protein Ead [Salmonella enterica subsp. enterica]EED8596003.1 protein Ead [Salmonella enterica subsp. enterica serovar Bonariensis]EKF0553031.1 ead/Ea22-like family protein [Salmonella enterica]